MIDEPLQEQAASYAAGAMSAAEREHFELILRFHTELRELVVELEEVTAAAITAPLPAGTPRPSPALRTRVFAMLDGRVQQTTDEAFVMAGPDGLVQWVNPAFSAMCGYTLDELRGKKLGPILQGEGTCKAAAARMRDAVQNRQPCTEALVNYHKNGTPYWVSVNITPLHDSSGELLYFIARELELPERKTAA